MDAVVDVNRPGLKMEERGTVEHHPGEPVAGLGGVEQLVRHTCPGEGRGDHLGLAPRAVVEAAGHAQQRGPGLGLQLAPRLEGLPGEANVVVLGVGPTGDPGGAV